MRQDSPLETDVVLEWPGDLESPTLLCEQVTALRWAADLQREGAARWWRTRISSSFCGSGQPLPFLLLLSLTLQIAGGCGVGCYPFALAFIGEILLM